MQIAKNIGLPCGQDQVSRIWKVQRDWLSVGKECCPLLSRRLWGGKKYELMKSATCNFTANSNIGRTNFDTHTLSSRDEVLISLDILLQVLLSSWCSERKVLVEDPGEGSGGPGPPLSKGMDDRPPPYLKVWIRH